MNASLDEKLKSVKWGEFRLGDLFEISNTNSFNSDKLTIGTKYDYVTRTSLNQGILQTTGFVNKENLNESGVWSLGLLQMDFFYRRKEWYAGQFVRKVVPKIDVKDNSILFFTTALNQQKKQLLSVLVRNVDETFKNLKIQLPTTKTNEIDFDFMESFISELEQERINKLNAYLEASGLKDYELTEEEEKILKDCDKWQWREFTFIDVFNNIKQGRRLKKEDQQEGDIPFVMSGTTNTGVVNYISNPVALFPSNSITIDIFGNTFYRNYEYGAGDDTGVYWNNEKNYSKLEMLFFATSMEKTLRGKFDFGNKLRSSQSENIKMQLPTQNSLPDYKSMETFIRAIEKLVVKDVVLYAEKKLGTMKEVAYSQSSASTLAAEASSYQSNCGGDN